MRKILSSFILGAMAVSAVAQNHALKISTETASTNAWDKQVQINIADANLAEATQYKITFDVKVDGAAFTFGVQTVDANSAHLGIWNATAAFNYIADCKPTTDWSEYTGYTDEVAHEACCVHCPKADTHTGSSPIKCPESEGEVCPTEEIKYATNTLYFNVGKLAGTLYIDNIKVYSGNGELVYTQDFESDGVLGKVKTPGWGDHTKLAITTEAIEVPSATGVNGVKAETQASKRIENGKIVIENNGNKYNVAGQIVK
jgi:hypothetical protein